MSGGREAGAEPSWSEMREILDRTMDLPARERSAYLDVAAGRGTPLRIEVDRYLALEDDAEGFLEAPPEDLARALGDVLEAGDRLGQFRIERKIGEGGMGEVYRAYDPTLDRRVAVKILPLGLGVRERDLAAFEQENKLLASLSHPNILEIHAVGRARGFAYAVTELLDGVTLRSRLTDGPLPIRDVCEIVAAVAEGLSAAHAKGVVHRDLKPENLFLTRSGQVKILDFGIATRVADDGADGRAPIGTRGYMAPEQIAGEPCDERTDLFALGVVLYELVTGRRPFDDGGLEGRSPFLDAEPEPIESLQPDAPGALGTLIRRCLETVPARRFQSAADLAFQLQAVASARRGRGRTGRRWTAVIATAAVLAVATLGTALVTLLSRAPDTLAPPRIVALTEAESDRAPDVREPGDWVAFSAARDGVPRVWLHQLSTGEERPLTAGPDRVARFSPDGQMVYFERQTPQGPTLMRVSTLGVGERAVMDRARSAAPSPGEVPGVATGATPGTCCVAFVRESEKEDHNLWALALAKNDGSDLGRAPRALSEPQRMPLAHLVWSPDARYVLAVRQRSSVGLDDDLLIFEPATGVARVVEAPAPGGRLGRPLWLTDDRLLLVVNESVSGYVAASRVLRFDWRTGRSETLFFQPQRIETLARAGDRRLIFDSSERAQHLWLVEWTEDGEVRAGSRLTRGRLIDRQPAWARGSWVFSSNRGGNIDLWRLGDGQSARPERVTDDPGEDWDPAVSPDGRRLAWSSNRSGSFEIHLADVGGHGVEPLTFGRQAENPSFSHDGAWIVYASLHEADGGLRRVRIDDPKDDHLITRRTGAHPLASPTGPYVVAHDHLMNGVTEVRVVRLEDGEPTAFVVVIDARESGFDGSVVLGRATWTPDGRAIAFLDLDPSGRVVVSIQPFDPVRDTGTERRVLFAPADGEIPESFAFAPDGRLLVSVVEDVSRLMSADFDEPLMGR